MRVTLLLLLILRLCSIDDGLSIRARTLIDEKQTLSRFGRSRRRIGTGIRFVSHEKYATEEEEAEEEEKEEKSGNDRDLLNECEERAIKQPRAHFSFAHQDEQDSFFFEQRYFVCAEHFRSAAQGPMFFYTGNEANVEQYVRNTGLMWENAEHFNALLVFAEHRYYGKSVVGDGEDRLRNLNSMEALADYAELIRELRNEYSNENPNRLCVIAFGGSYGGMLASWLRMKYPYVVDGAIAASAPIYAFDGETPEVDANAFAKGTTYTSIVSSREGQNCAKDIQRAFKVLLETGNEEDKIYLDVLKNAFRACDDVESPYEVAEWAMSALDYIAMGDYPTPSSYMLGGEGTMPAWPMKVVCEKIIDGDDDNNFKNSSTTLTILENLREAVATYYNATGKEKCFNIGEAPNDDTKATEDLWGYQYCTEMFMPMETRGGDQDIYWSQPWNETNEMRYCRDVYGVEPQPFFAQNTYGGRKIVESKSTSNIVFSNGLLDPWHGLGVLDTKNDQIKVILIDQGAHHLDLMFSNAKDPISVKRARTQELVEIQRWIDEVRSRAETSTTTTR